MDLVRSDFNIFAGGYTGLRRVFRPRADIPSYQLTVPLDWSIDPFNDRNWRFQLHAWRMIPPIWGEFYGNDWDRLKSEVLEWVCDWHDYHCVRQREADSSWQDMATGIRAEHLALVEHLRRRGQFHLNAREAGAVNELIGEHARRLMDPAFIGTGNHAIFQLKGLRLLGIVCGEEPVLAGEEEYSSDMMASLLGSQFRRDGVHVENSPDYHNFALSNFRQIRPELFPKVAKLMQTVLARAESIAPWFTLPNGRAVPIGDTEKRGPGLSTSSGGDASTVLPDGTGVVLRDLSKSGYAIVRSVPDSPVHRESMLVVNGQAFCTVHAHADQLGFYLYAFGVPLFVDSGKHSYNADHWRRYFTSAAAHNVVGVQGKHHGPLDTDLSGSCIESATLSSKGEFIIEGSVRRGGEFHHRRRYTYRPDEYIHIDDEVRISDEDRAVVYFHLDSSLEVAVKHKKLIVRKHGVLLATVSIDAEDFTPHLISGQVDPAIQGWVSPSYMARVAAPVVEFRASTGLRKWRTTVELFKPKRDVVFSRIPGLDVSAERLPFEFAVVTDRMVERSDGVERRIVMEVIGYPIEAVGEELGKALQATGFTARFNVSQVATRKRVYSDASGCELRVAVRSPEEFRTRLRGATASVYMAVIRRFPGAP